jgi:hypothetical protein
MRWSLIALLLLGCGDSGELAALKSSLANAQESIVETQATQIDKTDEAIEILRDNTTALAAIKSQIDALQVVSKPQQSGGDPKASPPESPAKADTQTPVKAATPGASSESLTELATRLYAQGVAVHMKTEDELKAIDAQLNGGAPVTGAMFQNNGASAITSQRNDLRLIPRGRTVFQWKKNPARKTCGPNGCY